MAIGVGAIAATTAVAVLATRSFNKEKRALDAVLKSHGDNLIRSQEKLTKRLSELENSPGSYKELTRKASIAGSAATKRELKSRTAARDSSNGARYLSDGRLDRLALKNYWNGRTSNSDFISAFAGETFDRGRTAVRRLLAVA